jgi:glycosyltransferase involved in cell wall biosynthesis
VRILYFSRDYTTHDRRFLARIAGAGHDVAYMRLENDGIPYETRPLPDGVRQVEWRGGVAPVSTPDAWMQLMPSFEEVLEHERPDVVHAGPVQSCGFMTAISGFSPFVLMSWGSDVLVDAERNAFWRWMTSYAARRADLFVCDSDAVATAILRYRPDGPCESVQFPWGVDLSQYTPGDASALRERLGWRDCAVIISTRTWEPIYGIDVLLEAFAQAHEVDSRLRLLLLGGGSRAGYVREFLQVRGLADVVHAPGIVSEEQLPELFRGADLYVSAAYSDGTSISLLQAMASGLPVIVTDAPGNREWIAPGRNGWLAEAGEPTALARWIVTGATLDLEAAREMGRANRMIVERRADWEKNSSRLLAAYERLVTAGGPSSRNTLRRGAPLD